MNTEWNVYKDFPTEQQYYESVTKADYLIEESGI